MLNKTEQFLEIYPSMEILGNIQLDLVQTNDLVTSLQLIEIAAPALHSALHDDLYKILPHLGKLITHPLKSVCLIVFWSTLIFMPLMSCHTY